MEENNIPILEAEPAIMKLTLHITRAATGKTEIVDVICTPIKENIDGCNPLNSNA